MMYMFILNINKRMFNPPLSLYDEAIFFFIINVFFVKSVAFFKSTSLSMQYNLHLNFFCGLI